MNCTDEGFTSNLRTKDFSNPTQCRLLTVWPDVRVKSSPIFSKSCSKISTSVKHKKCHFHNRPKMFLNIWATFAWNFVPKNFQKSPNLVTLATSLHELYSSYALIRAKLMQPFFAWNEMNFSQCKLLSSWICNFHDKVRNAFVLSLKDCSKFHENFTPTS